MEGAAGEDPGPPRPSAAALQPVPVKRFLACTADGNGASDQTWGAPAPLAQWQSRRASRRNPVVPSPARPGGACPAPCAAGAGALLGHCPDTASQTLFPPSCMFCFVSEMPVKCLSNTLFKSGENEAFAIYISLGSLKGGWICAMHMIYLF